MAQLISACLACMEPLMDPYNHGKPGTVVHSSNCITREAEAE